MNPYTNPHHLETLRQEAAQHDALEPLRALDRTSLRTALSEVVHIARRWTVGQTAPKARSAT
jgi:hypothetical protein